MNIQDLNQAAVSDVYSLSLQSDIIISIKECQYINVMNDTDFFYQWQIAQINRKKFTIISHQELETSNVVLISYKKSSSYSQQMMNEILCFYKNFVRFYINDLIIFLKILNDHKQHFDIIWFLFDEIRISLNKVKIYLDYSSIILLEQQVDEFDMTTFKKQIAVIQEIEFLKNLKDFEIYLDLTEWLQQYISYYAQLTESLQQRKIILLWNDFIKEKSRKKYLKKTQIADSFILEYKVFEII